MIYIFVYFIIGVLFVIDYNNIAKSDSYKRTLPQAFSETFMILLVWPFLLYIVLEEMYQVWRRK